MGKEQLIVSTTAPQRLQDADWLASRLGITRQRAYELVRLGLVPAVRLGRQVRFDAGSIEEWIRAGGTAGNGNADPSGA
jgi:excisionase family DNA binding protein